MLISRSQGLSRLQDFIKSGLVAYGSQRNHDLGAGYHQQNVSMLSPFLARRLLIESECINAALSHHSGSVISKWLDEVIWRIYWRGWLDHNPQIWSEYTLGLKRLCDDGHYEKANYVAAIRGNTGIASFDDWVTELKSTGYLHNHARMWFASIWIFTLRLPWQLGAEFFLRHLLDGDAAVNTLSWRWVAGLHTKGKRYLATAENIDRCTMGRVKVTERLATQSEADSVAHLSLDTEIANISAFQHFGSESFNAEKPSILIIHPDDLLLEQSELASANVTKILAIDPHCPVIQSQFATLATHALGQALKDGAARAQTHFGVPISWIKSDDLKTSLLEVQGPLVTMRPNRGLWFDLLTKACEHRPLSVVQRNLDAALFPYATKGFFSFREKVWANPATGLTSPK